MSSDYDDPIGVERSSGWFFIAWVLVFGTAMFLMGVIFGAYVA